MLKVGLVEAVWGLWCMLADAWRCADVGGHLECWWEVVRGKRDVEVSVEWMWNPRVMTPVYEDVVAVPAE